MKIIKRDRFGRLIEADRYAQCETCKNHSRSPDKRCIYCYNGSNYIPYDVEFRSLIGQYNHYYPSTPTPQIKNVIFNPPATIVFWADGTKTVVKAHGEEFDPEKGLAMAIAKKALGTGYYPEIKKWTEKYHQKKCYAEAWARKEKLDESMDKVADAMQEIGNTADTSRIEITMSKERWNDIMRGAIIDEDDAEGDDYYNSSICPECMAKKEDE